MLTAKDALSLATHYAYSEDWFCERVLEVVEKHAKWGCRTITLQEFCNYSEGFGSGHLERLEELGYSVSFDYVSGSLKVSW